MNEPSIQPEPPHTAVVEWGNERPGLLNRVVRGQGSPDGTGRAVWRHPSLPWLLGALGAAAMFGSWVGEWQVMPDPFSSPTSGQTVPAGIGVTLVWGPAWLIGALLLAVCGTLTLTGQPRLRPYARSVGLAVAGVELGVLAAAMISLSRENLIVLGDQADGLSVGRGAYAAFASVLLIGAAMYLAESAAPRPVPPQGVAADGGGPADLVVAPAEPLVTRSDDHRLR